MVRHLFELALSVLALDGFQSVKPNFERFIAEISSVELKSFYYALNCGIDVHKKLTVACLRHGRTREIRQTGQSETCNGSHAVCARPPARPAPA